MPVERAFKRLLPDQVQILFDESARLLRVNYIEVLTLLQDLLGKYSSKGNATVFIEPKEAENLIYEALSKLRSFTVTTKPDDFILPLDIENMSSVRVIEVTITPKSDVDIFDNTINNMIRRMRGKKRRVVSRKDSFRPGLVQGIFEENDEPNKGVYAVPVTVNDQAKTLSIYEQEFKIKQFTFNHFTKALGIDPRATNAHEAYDTLMEDIGTSKETYNQQDEEKITFFDSLQKTVFDSASENIVRALSLKSKCEKSAKISKESIDEVDEFLDELLSEYQLLRKPMTSRSTPPRSSQAKVPAPGKKHHLGKQG